MTRPLLLDLLTFVVPIALGAAAFLSAGPMLRRSKPFQFGLLAAAVLLVAVGVASAAGVLPLRIDSYLSFVGGSTVVLCWTAMTLLGAAWRTPGVSFSPMFLLTLAAVAGLVVGIESGGRLWWRNEPQMWERTPDERGLLKQTSGFTCSPTAAAMLLHKYGVAASEGELAYAAGTSAFGTDAHSMAWALSDKLQIMGRAASAERTGYDDMVRFGFPFIAHVRIPGIGNHALLVEMLTADGAVVLDPADGERHLIPRKAFEGVWDGTAILVPDVVE